MTLKHRLKIIIIRTLEVEKLVESCVDKEHSIVESP